MKGASVKADFCVVGFLCLKLSQTFNSTLFLLSSNAMENSAFRPLKMNLEYLDTDKMRRSVEKPI